MAAHRLALGVLEDAPLGVAILDEEQRIVAANRALQNLLALLCRAVDV